jgi:diguanylate cyclase (GGDEF)-like protein
MPQTAIISPLRIQDRLVGTLTIVSDVTERVQTERQMEMEVEKLNALLQIDQALTTLDLDQCLNTIIQKAGDLFNAEAIALLMRANSHLDLSSVRMKDDHPINLSLATWVNDQQLPTLVSDVLEDERYPSPPAYYRSEMATPLIVEGICFGVLSVQGKNARAYGRDDLSMLSALAARAATAIHNARLHTAERSQREMAEVLRDLSLTLVSETDVESILSASLEKIYQVIPFDSAGVIWFSDDIQTIHQYGMDECWKDLDFSSLERLFEQLKPLEWMYVTGQPLVITDTRSEPTWPAGAVFECIRSWLGAPIQLGTHIEIAGFICLHSDEPDQFTFEQGGYLAAIAAHVGIAIENARLYALQQKLAVTDGLTALSNRRHLEEELKLEIERVARYNRPSSLLMMDIDNFKKFNDQYGHLSGDTLLKTLSSTIRRNIRSVDLAARYGGEEFTVILPETGLAAARLVAERIRQAVENLHQATDVPPDSRPQRQVTISIGVAVAPEHGKTPEDLIRSADAAMYQAKRSGRNRTVTCADNDTNCEEERLW